MPRTRIRTDQEQDIDFLSESELNDFFGKIVITGTVGDNDIQDTEILEVFDGYFPGRGLIIGLDGTTVITGTEFVQISGTQLGVGSINTASGTVTIAGAGGNTIITEGQIITVSGFRDEFLAASGVLSDHGNLTGLSDDDHLQYHTDARGDARYYTQTQLNSTTSGSPGTSLIGFPTVSGFSINPISAEVSPSVQGAQSFFFSAGWVSGGEITDLGDETVLVASGIGAIRTQDDNLSGLVAFGWDTASGIAIANNTVRFLGVSYNSATDAASVLNKSSNTWNYNTEFPLGLAENRDNEIILVPIPHTVGNVPSLVNTRFEEVEGAQRADALGGLILGESGDTVRNVTMSAGVLWFKLNRFAIAAVDTSGSDTFDSFYRDGGVGFTQIVDETQWDDANYDDGSGILQPLTNNRFANLWFYLEVDGSLSCVYGREQSNKLADIELEPVPDTLPPGLANSVLLGRIIFFKDTDIAIDVQSAFDTTFVLSGASDHGSLAGLTDDDHLQYVREDGSRGFSATVSGVDPVDSDDLTTKNYVDTADTTISGHLQAAIDSIEVEGSEPAIIAGHGIVVTSGESTTLIDSFDEDDVDSITTSGVTFTGSVNLDTAGGTLLIPDAGTNTITISGGATVGQLVGNFFQVEFTGVGNINNTWLSVSSKDLASNITPWTALLPCRIAGISYSNANIDSGTDLEIHVAAEGAGNANVLKFTYEIRNSRTSWKSDFGLSQITLGPGDKMALFARTVLGTKPKDMFLGLYLEVTARDQQNSSESFSGNFS